MTSQSYDRAVPSRHRLEGSRCRGCGKVSYPPRVICPACRSEDAEPTNITRGGKVVTSTVVRVSPDDFLMESPYAMALVETPEGARLMVQVADCDPAEVKAGMEVSLEFRLIRKEDHGGVLCYGHKAVPVD